MAAVSILNIVFVSFTGFTFFCFRKVSSSGVKPPSGPMKAMVFLPAVGRSVSAGQFSSGQPKSIMLSG